MNKIIGLENLTKNKIEEKAETLLKYFDPTFFLSTRYTPLPDITKYLMDKNGIYFDFDSNLGFTDDGRKLLGLFIAGDKKSIYVDSALRGDEKKFNFTLAHELGHLALHRKLKFEGKEDFEIIDFAESESEGSPGERTEYEWMEWQANYYAGCLLMPREQFKPILADVKKSMDLHRWPGKVFVDNQPVNLTDYYNITLRLSDIFRVSRSAVEIRLRNLEMVEDHRKKGYFDTSELAKQYLKRF